ncbi:unnamed protein product, partial [Acanthoscelides obtectus]
RITENHHRALVVCNSQIRSYRSELHRSLSVVGKNRYFGYLGWPRGSECRATDQPASRAASGRWSLTVERGGTTRRFS